MPAALTVILILGIGFAVNSYLNLKLIKGNKALVEQLVKILQESSIAKQKIKGIEKERQDLQLKIQALQLEIKSTEEEKANLEKLAEAEESKSAQKINELNACSEKLARRKPPYRNS